MSAVSFTPALPELALLGGGELGHDHLGQLEWFAGSQARQELLCLFERRRLLAEPSVSVGAVGALAAGADLAELSRGEAGERVLLSLGLATNTASCSPLPSV